MNAPAWPAAEKTASTWARGVPVTVSWATAALAVSDSTAGEKRAAAKPMSRTAPMTVAVLPAWASQQNPAMRRTQPVRTTGLGP